MSHLTVFYGSEAFAPLMLVQLSTLNCPNEVKLSAFCVVLFPQNILLFRNHKFEQKEKTTLQQQELNSVLMLKNKHITIENI